MVFVLKIIIFITDRGTLVMWQKTEQVKVWEVSCSMVIFYFILLLSPRYFKCFIFRVVIYFRFLLFLGIFSGLVKERKDDMDG